MAELPQATLHLSYVVALENQIFQSKAVKLGFLKFDEYSQSIVISNIYLFLLNLEKTLGIIDENFHFLRFMTAHP